MLGVLYILDFFFKGGIYELDLGHYVEGVHQSRILGEWSNVINYEMGSSLIGVYTTTIFFSLVKNSKDGCKKITWLSTWQHFLLGEFSEGRVSWVTSNPLTRNLASEELQLEGFFPSCPPYSPLPKIIISWVEILH